MSGLSISIEAISEDSLAAYSASGMQRGELGPRALDWAFKHNPKPFAVARLEGEVVGLSAYIRSNLTLSGRPATALQAVDSFVFDKARGKGVFTALAKAYEQHARQDGADLIWGFPNANAAPAWFGKLGWNRLGQVPFLIKPLRAGFLMRKLRLPLDFPVSFSTDQKLEPISAFGAWSDALWSSMSPRMECTIARDRAFLSHRLFQAPHSASYRIVAAAHDRGAFVATTEAQKHGGHIAYLLEAMGHADLDGLLASEMGRLRDRGVEVVLAWSYPWSANYRTLRKAGFLPLPERLRPIEIWFGSRPLSSRAAAAGQAGKWYVSYLDSDTI